MTTEKENAPELLAQSEGKESETKRLAESKVQTMTNHIFPHSESKPKILVSDLATVVLRHVLAPLGEWADDHDIERIADAVFSWDEEQQGFYQNCTVEEFWAIVEACRLETCTFTGCDDQGQQVLAERHGHNRKIGVYGGTHLDIAPDDEGVWHIVQVDTAPMFTADDARDLARGLVLAANEVRRLNPRRVRRPIDWAAQPDLDGEGGAL